MHWMVWRFYKKKTVFANSRFSGDERQLAEKFLLQFFEFKSPNVISVNLFWIIFYYNNKNFKMPVGALYRPGYGANWIDIIDHDNFFSGEMDFALGLHSSWMNKMRNKTIENSSSQKNLNMSFYLVNTKRVKR